MCVMCTPYQWVGCYILLSVMYHDKVCFGKRLSPHPMSKYGIVHNQCLHYLVDLCLYYPSTGDKELEELGVKTIGDRAVLRKRCREADQGMLL